MAHSMLVIRVALRVGPAAVRRTIGIRPLDEIFPVLELPPGPTFIHIELMGAARLDFQLDSQRFNPLYTWM